MPDAKSLIKECYSLIEDAAETLRSLNDESATTSRLHRRHKHLEGRSEGFLHLLKRSLNTYPAQSHFEFRQKCVDFRNTVLDFRRFLQRHSVVLKNGMVLRGPRRFAINSDYELVPSPQNGGSEVDSDSTEWDTFWTFHYRANSGRSERQRDLLSDRESLWVELPLDLSEDLSHRMDEFAANSSIEFREEDGVIRAYASYLEDLLNFQNSWENILAECDETIPLTMMHCSAC